MAVLEFKQKILAADAILILATSIVTGLEVREPVIARHVADQMPFMATERWLMLGVQSGGDRQALHDVIRRHSLAVADAVGAGGENDLMERLKAEPAFSAVDRGRLAAELEPSHHVGRSVEQVAEFHAEYLDPLLVRARGDATPVDSADVRV